MSDRMGEVRCLTLRTEWQRGRVRVTTPGPARRPGGEDLVAPFDVRVVWRRDREVHVVLVPTMALLLDGDRIELRISVGAGTKLRVIEVSGTVAYSGPGAGSSYRTDIDVAKGAALVWLGQPFVVAAGAVVQESTVVSLAPGAVACIRETLVLGRTGEGSGVGQIGMRIEDETGPLFVEELHVGDTHALPGILGPAKVLDQVVLVGTRPTEPHPDTLHLAGRGAINRRLAGSAHVATDDALAECWADQAFGAVLSPGSPEEQPK